MVAPALSHDTLFDGKLFCSQSLSGYRFSIDAILLAHFLTPRPEDQVLDLGAGCGVISLILAYRHPSIVLTCLEIQDSLVALISHNIGQNGFADRISLLRGDLRSVDTMFAAGSFDSVVCNPPYYSPGRGRQSPNNEQAVARHELEAGLADFAKAAAFSLRTKGRLVMIYPATRGVALLLTLRQYRLEPKRLQVVHSYPGAAGGLLLVEAVKAGGEELTVLPPLYVYDRPGGQYSQEVAAFYRSRFGE
ncbi:MAG: methyltransferase [Desulfobulbaceae bacterium]|nr:methyltransferase [Desulfobulbaceae bacterium]